MSNSIYATPEAEITAPSIADADRYYVVSPFKFMLLSIMTFGLYYLYWFYRNWKQVKTDDNSDIWPVPRAIFYVFFTHSLMSDIDIRVKEKAPDYSWQPALVATLFVLLAIANNVIDRLIPDEMLSGWIMLGSISFIFIMPLLLVQAQKAINVIMGDVAGKSNSRLTAANFVWIVIGVLFWLMVAIGVWATFNPDFLLES